MKAIRPINYAKQMFPVLVMAAVKLGAADTLVIDPLLNEEEIAWLERENTMWRLVRVEEEAKANLEKLGRSGFAPEEVGQIQERLLAIWGVEVRRNRGLLTEEAMERIRDVDEKFVTRMRAVRLYEVTGIQSGHRPPETMGELQRDWHRAIRRVLDHGEFSEFRLLNSPSALRVAGLLEGVQTNNLELRTICLWQREFERTHGFQRGPAERKRDIGFAEAKLEHGRRLQALLGPGRFMPYLRREEPAFDRLAQAIGPDEAEDWPTALTLWWIHQEHEIVLMKASRRIEEWVKLHEELTGKVMVLLGPDRYESYRRNADEIWAK